MSIDVPVGLSKRNKIGVNYKITPVSTWDGLPTRGVDCLYRYRSGELYIVSPCVIASCSLTFGPRVYPALTMCYVDI